MVQTAAVGQQMKRFPVRVAPFAYPLDVRHVAIDFPSKIETVEITACKRHLPDVLQIHVDRRTNGKLLEIHLHEFRDGHGHRRKGDQINMLPHHFDAVLHMVEKTVRDGVSAIAGRIEQQDSGHADFMQHIQILAENGKKLHDVLLAARADGRPPAGIAGHRKEHLRNPVAVFVHHGGKIRVAIVAAHLVADGIFLLFATERAFDLVEIISQRHVSASVNH